MIIALPFMFSLLFVGDQTPQDRYWASLATLCGQNFHGEIVVDTTSNPFEGLPRIEVKSCDEQRLEIGFSIGSDRSRTWILTRTKTGLNLNHDHRHADGTPDKITNYGGDTIANGTAERQAFIVDAYTIELVAGTEKNIWVFEILGGKTLAYELYKGSKEPVFRVEFDLTKPQ